MIQENHPSINHDRPPSTSSLRRTNTTSYLVCQGSSISGPRAKSGPRRPQNWPAEQSQNAENNYCIFFQIRSSVLKIYIFISVIYISILVKFSSAMQDAVQLL